MFGQWINKRMRAILFALIGAMILMSGAAQAESISGTAPDGILIAVDSTNTVLQIAEGEGTPGIPGKTATMSGLPVNQDITLYLFADGALLPIVFENGTLRTFQLLPGAAIDIGFINIDFMAGQAAPAAPINSTLVQPGNLQTFPSMRDIQNSLLTNLGALTAIDLIEYGKGALRHGWMVAADKFFTQADILASSGTDVDLKNKTHILRALSSVMAKAMDTATSSPSAVTNFASAGVTLGDLLAAFGCQQRHLGMDWMHCPDDSQVMALMSLPNGSDISGWLNANMIPVVQEALVLLNAIPDTMVPFLEDESQWAIDDTPGIMTEIDYSDVLAVKSIFEFILGQLYLNQAYNWTVDIDAALNLSTQQMLIDNPNFGILSAVSSTNLAAAKAHLTNAAQLALDAMAAIQAETDDQNNDFVTLLPAEVTDASFILNQFKTALTTLGPTQLMESNVTGARSLNWNLSKIFDGINLRTLLPAITGNKVTGLFPVDNGLATFGGLFPDGFYNFSHDSLNQDANQNNIPDILEDAEPQYNQPPGGGMTVSSTVLNLTVGGTGNTIGVQGGMPPYAFQTSDTFFIVTASGQVTCSSVGSNGVIHVSDSATPYFNQQTVTVHCADNTGGGTGGLNVSPTQLNLVMGGTPATLTVTGGVGPYAFQTTATYFTVGTTGDVTCSAVGMDGVIQVSDAATPIPNQMTVAVLCGDATGGGGGGGGGGLSVTPTQLNLVMGGTPATLTVTGGVGPYAFQTTATYFTVGTTGEVTCSAVGMDGVIQVSDAATPIPNQMTVAVLCGDATGGGGGGGLSVTPTQLNLVMGGTPATLTVTGGVGPYAFQTTATYFTVGTTGEVTCSAVGSNGVVHVNDSTTPTALLGSVMVECTAATSTTSSMLDPINLSVGATRTVSLDNVTGTPSVSVAPDGVITLATSATGPSVTCDAAGSATVTITGVGAQELTMPVTCVAVGTPDTSFDLTQWLFPGNATFVNQERSAHEEGANTWVNKSMRWVRYGGTTELLDRGTVSTEVSDDGGMYYSMTPNGLIFHGEYRYDVWNGQSSRSIEYGFVTPPDLTSGLVAADVAVANLTQPGVMIPANVASGDSSTHVAIRYELDANNQPINDKWAVVKTEMFVTGNVNLLGAEPPEELVNDPYFGKWRNSVTDPALLAKLTHVLRIKMVNTRYEAFGNLPSHTQTEYMYVTQGDGWVYQFGDEDHGVWQSALVAKDDGTTLTSLTNREIAARKVRIDAPAVLTKPYVQMRAEHNQGVFATAPHSHELIGTVNETPTASGALFTIYSPATALPDDVIDSYNVVYGAVGYQRKVMNVLMQTFAASTAANPLILPLTEGDVGRAVTFTVVNASGTPVTDAGVQISPYDATTSACQQNAMGAYFGVDASGVATAILGDGPHCVSVWPNNGATSFNGGWYNPNAAPGSVNITMEGNAFNQAVMQVTPASTNLLLVVGSGTTGGGGGTPPPVMSHVRVTGTLTNGTTGVNNAEVLAYPDHGGEPFVFHTDNTGAFAMDLPEGEYTFAFRYKGTGFVAQAYLVSMGETLTLSASQGMAQNIQSNTILGTVALTAAYQVPTFALSGTVTDSTTGRVNGAVEVQVMSSVAGGYFAHAMTSATGTYTLDVPAGSYYIEFMAKGTGMLYRGFVNASNALSADKADRVPVAISAATTLDVALTDAMGVATIAITGTVNEGGATPQPVLGATVRAVNQDNRELMFEAHTDAAGLFALDVVPGPYKIEFFAHEYQSGWASGEGTAVTLLNDVFAQNYVLGGTGGLATLVLNPSLTKSTGGGGYDPGIAKIAITGTVTGGKGPLENIQVEFQPDWGNNTGFVDMAWAKTSSTGTYTASIYPGKYRVEFRAEYWDNATNSMVKVAGVLGRGGFATATGGTTEMMEEANIFDFTAATTLNATLSSGIEVSGNVSNADGPLAGVKVELQPDWDSNTATGGTVGGTAPVMAEWTETTTDAQGNYSVFVKSGAVYRVFFNTDYWDWKTNTQVKVSGGLSGYAVGTDSKVNGDMMAAKKYQFTAATVVNAVLSAGLTVSGVVTSDGTTPVGNVLVRLQPEWDPETGNAGTWGEKVTAADGSYSFSVQPGKYRVEFMTSYWNWQTQSEGQASISGLVGGFAADTSGGIINDWMNAHLFTITEPVAINAKLSAGMTISGMVVTQSGGTVIPVDGAEVNAHSLDWTSNFRAKAAADGTFTMAVNPGKEYVVEVWPKFCSGTGGTPNPDGCGGVVFQGGNWITPPDATWVTGWVAEDHNTQPVVTASAVPDTVLTYNATISGQQPGVVPGMVMSQWDEHIVTRILVDKSIVLGIVVDAGTPITGKVVDASDNPIPYAWVNSPFGGGATDANGNFTINLPSSNVGTVGDGKFDVNIFPGGSMDANGVWTKGVDFIGGVVTGSEATGFILTGDWQQAVRFESDMTVNNPGEIVWPAGGLTVRVGSGLTISGKVKKSDGTGIPNLWINAWSQDTGMGGGEGTDQDGNYAIRVPTPAAGATVWYEVNLWSSQYIAPEPVLVKMDAQGVVGVYQRAKDKFVQDANGFFRPEAGTEITERDANNKVVVNFTLTTGNKISGRVTDSSNKGLAWTWVDIHTKDGTKWYGANTDENGYYTATVDPAANYVGVVWGMNGQYRTNFYKNAGSEDNATLIDASGSNSPTNINFLMSTGAKITGSILGLSSGQKLWVNVWSESQRSWGGTEVTGSGTGTTAVNFEIKGLASAKDYRLDWNSNTDAIPNGFYGGVAGSGTASGPKSWEQATLLSTMNGNVTGVAITLAVSTKTLTVKVDGLTAGSKVDADARSDKLNKGRWKQATADANGVATIVLKGLENSDDYRLFIGGPNATFKVGNFMGTLSSTALPTTAGSIVGWDRATKIDMSTDQYAYVSVSSGRQLTVKVSGLQSGQKAWVDAFSETTFAWGGGEVSYGNGTTDQVILKGLEAADDYRVSIWSPQIMGGSYTGDGNAPGIWEKAQLVDVSGGDKTITMAVSSGRSIAGSVTGLSTAQNGWVDAWSNSTFSWGGASVQGAGASTAVDYSLAGLGTAADFQVTFNAPGFVPQKKTNQSTVAGNLTGVNFTASTGGSIKGSISGLKAFEWVRVDAWSPTTDSFIMGGTAADSAGAATYTLSGVPDATDYVVGVWRGDKGLFYATTGVTPVWDNHSKVTVSGSGTTSGIDFNLTAAGTLFYSLSGTISGLSSSQVVEVRAWSATAGASTTVTGNTTFTLEGLPAGSYSVEVFSNGYIPQRTKSVTVASNQVSAVTWTSGWNDVGTVAIAGNTTGLNITLSTGYSIKGTVKNSSNTAVSGAWVNAWSESANVGGGALTNSLGEFTIKGLPGGSVTYKVDVWTPEGSGNASVTVTNANQTGVALTIGKATGSITGTVSGTAAAGALVLAYDSTGAEKRRALANATTGAYTLDDLTPDQAYTIKVFSSTKVKAGTWSVKTSGYAEGSATATTSGATLNLTLN